ncbi:uncharacterized protein PHACADRAFT_263128 [Phanerochaete carnosa HHB-10118-sp]|uniref:Uncharacterized protein n=1 Tax=Phanerochaete carnosa (strain HHB-10118-sp) TaxID=650164 RepID=K5UN28_PHACS|nr:uncharacterized protein PHACADRAFT_263128 [Phanerochaete carnosa HHB-10118-sp]EKM51136.1 hypothetical protein PHACADRAFT_263128 [Phanerochaete carnosa HHB-10118-sp]
MSSTASGEIHTTGPASLEGNFTTDAGDPYVIDITTNDIVDAFKCDSATLTYDKLSDMTGRVTITGNVGADVHINCDRDGAVAVITGTVTTAVDPPDTIMGSGRWALRSGAKVSGDH